MNSTWNNFLIFAAGAAIGSVVTWKLLRDKYEQITQEETKDIKERFSKRLKEMEDQYVYENITHRYSGEQQGVSVEEKEEKNEKKEEAVIIDHVRVISPDEYGDNPDEYETESLTYYADGILADSMDEMIEDVEDVVGNEALGIFNDSTEDSVFVRNNRHKCDYEILRDTREYSEVKRLYNPHPTEE